MNFGQPGKSISQYLKENGISQAFLSRKTGIAPSKLSQSLKGNRKLTFSEYEMICGALNVNTDKFLKPRLPDESST